MDDLNEKKTDQNDDSENKSLSIPNHDNLPSNRHSNVPSRLKQAYNNRKIGAQKKGSNNSDGDNVAKNKLANNKNNKKGLFSRFRKKQQGNNDDTKEEEKKDTDTSTSDTSDSESGGELVGAISRIKRIKRTLIIIGVSILVFFLLLIVIAVASAIAAFLGTPVTSVNSYGTNNFQAISAVGTVEYQEEMGYYNKIKEKATNYKNKCGSELNINFMHASLVYYYYKVDLPNDYNGSDKSIIDYSRMASMVDKIANLMYGSSCSIDYSKNGSLYQKMRNDSDFNNYYRNVLNGGNDTIESILDDIFDLAQEISVQDDMVVDNNFIPEETRVVVNSSTSRTSNGLTNNNTSNSNKNSTINNKNITSVSFKEYILGVLYANVSSNDLKNDNKMKAYIVAYTTSILNKNKLSINSKSISLSDYNDILYCNVDEGCSYTTKQGNQILQVGGSKGGDGNNIFYEGKYYAHVKMNTDDKIRLSKLIDEVYGIVLIDSSSQYPLVDISKIKNTNLNDYKEILHVSYPDLTIKIIREDVYDNGVNYGNKKVTPNTIFYDQNDYGDIYFCHRTGVSLSKNSIASSGCGTTAMSILVSSYENSKQYDPVYMNERAYQTGNCGYKNGTYINFFHTTPSK